MRDWPWLLIIVASLLIGWLVPLPFDGWLNLILFWGAFLGAVAYSVHARRAFR